MPNVSSQPNYSAITQRCNLWRNFDDIQDSWASVESIIDYYGDNQDIIAANAAPGHWNDPDMVSKNNIDSKQDYQYHIITIRLFMYLYFIIILLCEDICKYN